jgi:hypothetical protein
MSTLKRVPPSIISLGVVQFKRRELSPGVNNVKISSVALAASGKGL